MTELEKQQLMVDFSRPGYNFIINVLEFEEEKARNTLKIATGDVNLDLANLTRWRTTVEQLELIKNLPKKMQHVFHMSFDPTEIPPDEPAGPSFGPPAASYI